MVDYERKIWTFRGDKQLDPILKKWSDQSEKSFHLRQALRGYLKLTQRSDSSAPRNEPN